MATVPPIRQTIKFEGLEEIKKKLSELGGAGEKAFEDLRAASAPAVQSMERLEGAIANVQRSMASVAVTGRQFGTSIREAGVAFNGFEQSLSRTVRSVRNYGAVLAAAVAGVALFVRSGIQAGDDIEEQAQALGLSTQAYQELGFAASEAGVKQGQFASGVKIFSQQIQKASADAAKSMLAFVEGIDKNFDTLGGRIQRVTDAAVVPFTTIREAARNLQSDLAAQGISRPLFEIEQGFRKLAAGGAEGRAEFERLGRVSLPAARDGLDVLRDGSEKSIKALNKLLPTFKRTEDGSVDLGDAFLKVADHFKALPDGVQKTAQAMAFFGRSAGPQLVPFLNQGSAGIGDFLAKTRELGLTLSGPQIKASADAARSFDLLARSATNVKNQIGAAFAPVARTIASGFTDFLSKNQIAINAFADDLNTKATPYVQAFFDMLAGGKHHEGENVTEAGEKIDQIRQRFVSFGESVRRVGAIIGNAFTAILAVLDKVAFAFNAVFNTSLTGAELGVILVVAKLVGGFALLLASLRLLGGAFSVLNSGLKLVVASGGLVVNALRAVGIAIAAVLGGPAAIAAAFALATVAIIANWDDVKKALKSIGIDVDALAEHIKTAFGIDLVALLNIPQVKATIETTKKEWAALTAFLGTNIEAFIATTKREWAALTSFLGTDIKAFVETTKKEFALLIAAFEFIQSTFNKRASRRVATSSFDEVGMAAFVKEVEAANQKLASVGPVAQAAAQQVTTAITQAATSVQTLGTAADNAGKKTVTVLGGTANAAKQIVPAVKEASDAYTRLADAFGPLSNNVTQIGTDFDQSNAAQRQFWADANKGVGQAVDSTTRLKDGVTSVGLTFRQEQDAVAAFGRTGGKAIDDLSGKANLLKSGVTEIGTPFKQSTEALLAFRTKGIKAFDDISNKVKTALGPVATDAQLQFANLTEAAKASGQSLADAFGSVEQKVEQIGTDGTAFTDLKAAMEQAGAGAAALLAQVTPVDTAFDQIGADNTAFTDLKANMDQAGVGAAALLAQVTPLGGQINQAFAGQGVSEFKIKVDSLSPTLQSFVAAFGQISPAINQAFGTSGVDAFKGKVDELPPTIDRATTSGTNLGNAFTQALSGVSSLFDGVNSSIGSLISQIDIAIAKLREMASAKAASGAGGFDEAGFEGFARGGHVRGPGTSTSDSILARLSRGEFVQREKAVRYYGADFMAALNALRIPKDMFRGFNAGGLVDGLNQSLSALMIPRFAVGGLPDMAPAVASSSGRSLTLVLDGQRFAGLRGPDDTIARLEKHAIAQQSGSTGRKPSWVR